MKTMITGPLAMAEQHEDYLKSVSLSPTTTSLIRSTADLLSTELKDFVETKIQSAKAKKEAENLKSPSENKNCTKMIGSEGVAWPPRVKLSRERAPAGRWIFRKLTSKRVIILARVITTYERS